MSGKKKRTEGFKEFFDEYNATEIPQSGKPINCSKFTLKEQLKRFANFSHTKDECEIMSKEAQSL